MSELNLCIKICGEYHEDCICETLEAYYQGYADGSLSVTEEIKGKVIDDCITKLLTESITCFSDVIATLEQLKEQTE